MKMVRRILGIIMWSMVVAVATTAQEVLTSFSGSDWNIPQFLPVGWSASGFKGGTNTITGEPYEYESFDDIGGRAGCLNDRGDYLRIQLSGTAIKVVYWLAHEVHNNGHPDNVWGLTTNRFVVQASVDRNIWTEDGTNCVNLREFTFDNPMSATPTCYTNDIPPGMEFIRFYYEAKTQSRGGNVGIDGVIVKGFENFGVALDPDEGFEVDKGAVVSNTATPVNAVGEVSYSWACTPDLPGEELDAGRTVVWDTSRAADTIYTATCTAFDGISYYDASVDFTVNQPASLPTFFSGPDWHEENTLPNGWRQSGMAKTNYANYDGVGGGAGRFDTTDDSLTIFFEGEPTTLTYYLRYNTGGSTWATSGNIFDVLESADGETWTTLDRFDSQNVLPASGPAYTHDLNPASKYVKFVYVNKVNGNVGIDGVKIDTDAFYVVIEPPRNQSIIQGDVLELTALSGNASGAVSYTWSNSYTAATSSGDTFAWNTAGVPGGTYTVECMAFDGTAYATASVSIAVFAPALLPTSFSGPDWHVDGALPMGWSQSGIGTNVYVNYDGQGGHAGAFDTTGDSLTIVFAGTPTTLHYWLQHNPAGSVNWAATANRFVVEESIDGETWTVLAEYNATNPIPSSATRFGLVPSADARYIRFVYANKTASTGGNVGIDGVVINGFQGFGVRLDPALDFSIPQGDTIAVAATPHFETGAVFYDWSLSTIADAVVEGNQFMADMDTPGDYTVVCVAFDGQTYMTNQVASQVIAPPAPSLPPAAATMPTAFSGPAWGRDGALPTNGWVQSGMGADYTVNYDSTNGVAGSFRATGTSLTIRYASTANTLTYWLQHNHGGAGWAKTTNVFFVLESIDGTTWTTLRRFDAAAPIPGGAAQFISTPSPNSRYIRFIYDTKAFHGGNVGIDGISLSYETAPVIPLSVQLNPDAPFSLAYNASKTITALADGGTGAGTYTYAWETDLPEEAVLNESLDSAILEFAAIDSLGGSYYALVTVTDANGLTEVAQVLFTTLPEGTEPLNIIITDMKRMTDGRLRLTVDTAVPYTDLVVGVADHIENGEWKREPLDTTLYEVQQPDVQTGLIPILVTPSAPFHIIGITY